MLMVLNMKLMKNMNLVKFQSAERRSVFDIKKEPGAYTESSKNQFQQNLNILIHSFNYSLNKILIHQQKQLLKMNQLEPTDTPKSEESLNDPSQLILMQFPDVLPCTRTSSSSTKPELVSLK